MYDLGKNVEAPCQMKSPLVLDLIWNQILDHEIVLELRLCRLGMGKILLIAIQGSESIEKTDVE